MHTDWTAVATIAAPIIALFVGVWINRRFEDRPALVTYFGHVAAFVHHPATGAAINVHTHSVVLRNVGRQAATNVRIHHMVLPDFNVWPSLQYNVETLPDGSRDIVIPILVAREELTVSYLYFPPVTVAQVNAGIKCDQGLAQQIPVLLQRQYSRWFNSAVAALLLLGLVSAFYLAYRGLLALLR